MPRTPDRAPGVAQEEGIDFEDTGVAPSAGSVRYTGTRFSLKDASGEYDPRSGGGISEAQHGALDTLIHNLAETCYTEVTRAGGQVNSVTTWTSSGKTTKVRSVDVTRSAGQVATITRKHYDGAGALITGQTMTGTVARSGGRVTSIDWVQS